jgi:hypothetical protein
MLKDFEKVFFNNLVQSQKYICEGSMQLSWSKVFKEWTAVALRPVRLTQTWRVRCSRVLFRMTCQHSSLRYGKEFGKISKMDSQA